jgi:hypothetical protein
MKKTYAFLALVGALCACGSRTALEDGSALGGDLLPDGAVNTADPALFVGTWTCESTTTGNDGDGNYSDSGTEVLTVVANPDGSLTMTAVTHDVGVCPSLTWFVSGSTATIEGGQTCPSDYPYPSPPPASLGTHERNLRGFGQCGNVPTGPLLAHGGGMARQHGQLLRHVHERSGRRR